MYKVIEVANMLNVSKVTVYKKMTQLKKELKPFIKKKKNITYLETEAIELIKNSLAQFSEEDQPEVNELVIKKVEDAKKELESSLEQKDIEIDRIAANHIVELQNQLDYLEQQVRVKEEVLKQKTEIVENLKVIVKSNKESLEFINRLEQEKRSE